jgi:lysosomal acid lipase/cholesteryl ester hydrolase
MKGLAVILLILVPSVWGDDNDPELQLGAPELAAYWNYPYEIYYPETEDGYRLELIRIPNKRGNFEKGDTTKRPVVFLQHGLEGSAADWVTNLPNQAAAFVFADAGFDVWLGNFRGNYYSKSHKTLSPTEHSFWEFSWDQMAKYDLPAMIDMALNVSRADQLYYVGFSLGTTTGFAKFSQDREFAKKIKRFYALAPMVTVKHIKGPLALMAKFTGPLEFAFKLIGMDEFTPNEYLMDFFARTFCGHAVSDLLCKNLLFLIGGPESKQLNSTRIPVYLSHSPAGTSTQTMIHMGQMVNSGKFQAYDYGKKGNQEHYHQNSPFEYDASELEVPTEIYTGGDDWLATPKDVQDLIPQLRTLENNVYLKDFNDFDFIWGLRAAPEVYFPIRKSITADFGS